MTFQIIKDGKIMFQTNEESCVPSAEQLKEMHKHGYKYKTIKDKK